MKDLNAVEILLVEDNPRDAELTMRALRKNNLANNAIIAGDGEEALDFFFCGGNYKYRNIKRSPRVVLLDLILPKISGLEVLKAVKADDRTSHIPIVVIASSTLETDIVEAYKMGANSYVVKPAESDQLINAMNSLGLYWLLVNETLR